jgi:predicted HicB family RNase H-like nuclease
MMEHKGYVGRVEFDPDAGILHGEVVGLRDVVTFQGKSVQEVERAFRDSVDDYLAFCEQRREAPDKPCSGQFVVRMEPQLHRKASLIAAASGKSLNALVVEAVARRIEGAAVPNKSTKTAKRRKARTR